VKPLNKSSIPGFEFNVNATIWTNEVIYDIGGSLYSEDDVYIGTIRVSDERFLNGPNIQDRIDVPALGESNQGQRTLLYPMMVELGERALNHLEKTRLKNGKKDVLLKGKLRWSQLSFKIKVGKYRYYPIPTSRPPISAIVPSNTIDETNTGLSILNGEQRKIADVGSANLNFNFKIPHSDWTTDFYEAFGIGRIILIEAPSISQGNFDKGNIKNDGDYKVLAKRLESIGPYFQAMIESMKTGDWGEVVGKSRFIYESLTKNDGKQALKKILLEDTNIDEANLSQLITGLDNMYQFSSGLHHSLNKSTGAPKEIYVGRREDAELMYYLSVSLVNALMSKLNRLS
jgi:hypothetical protein